MLLRYLDFARELKRLSNMKTAIILKVVHALGTITKNVRNVDKREMIENRNHSDQSTTKIGLDSQKSPLELRFSFFQTKKKKTPKNKTKQNKTKNYHRGCEKTWEG